MDPEDEEEPPRWFLPALILAMIAAACVLAALWTWR